ncbi:MAG TPA: hypothetical protein VMV87_17385 [Burkholderiales bacterium]|nr:hypothetical protein [Burkholderiales bacterium]
MPSLEIGMAVVDPRRLTALSTLSTLRVSDIADLLGDEAATAMLPGDAAASHLYFGSEFCEHLFPEREALERAAAVSQKLGLTLVVATPVANDALLVRIGEAAAALPETAEILVNDWGVASFLRAAYPQRRLVAGRQLAKMIKDPRLPSAAWMKPYSNSYSTPGHRRLLERLGIARIELDVPPFATPGLYEVADLALSVWAPYAYVAKGRICKIGSLRQELPEKFAPGRPCHHECLGMYELGVNASPSGIASYARGNSLYYRHDAAMTEIVRDALEAGRVTRVVFSGV